MSDSTGSAPADTVKTVSLYQAHKKIYPKAVRGTFARWRWIFVWLTQIVFYGLPWLNWGDRQALLFELTSRRFYIFGLVFYPQDFIYLTSLLLLAAYSLFLFTAVSGRLWCGYACPQTVYTEIFLWIEKQVEGDRSARMRLDQSDLSARKFGKKWLKHALWILFSLWTGFTFAGYFTPIRELGAQVLQASLGPWQTFWLCFYSFATYGMAGFMREQVCKYMCPYARFQSAMFDKDTLIITYDTERGEPRGPRSRKADPAKLSLGACVDCKACVHACPTGIDIRKGLQYECIGCAACIDACDEVMDRWGYARGLVRYDTQNGLSEHLDRRALLRRVMRPRILVYTSILLLIVVGVAFSIAIRPPFKADVVRDRAVMARLVDEGWIENVYRLQIMNATEARQTYVIGADGLPGLRTAQPMSVTLGPAEAHWVPVSLQVPPETASSTAAGAHEIHFTVERQAGDGHAARMIREKSTFFLPR